MAPNVTSAFILRLMRCRSAVLLLLLLFVPSLSQGQSSTLEFVKEIGVAWPPEKSAWVNFVSFSPDGTMVASDGPPEADDNRGNLTLWSFPDGQLIKQLPAQPTAMSRDWRYYASYQGVRELESGKSVISLGTDQYAIYTFSPDSRYAAESLAQKNIHDPHIRVVELATGKQLSTFGRHDAFSMAISPDGKTLATGHWNIVTLWKMFRGERVAVLRGFDRYVKGLAFSEDGKLLAAGTDFGGLQVWDVSRKKRVLSLDIGGSDVSQPSFSPDSRLIAVGIYGTGTVWLIDVTRGKIVDHKKVSDIGCGSVAFSPDGRSLIAPSTGGLVKWPPDRGGTIRVFKVSTQ